MRRVLALLTVGVLVAGCSGSDTGTVEGPTTSIGQEDSTPPTGAETTGTTTGPSVDACALVEPSGLEVAFPDGAPEPTSSGANRGSSCQWGDDEANLTVTVWPGDEFYSSCDACQPLALGDAGWIDGSEFFWTALVVSGDMTVQVIAAGLGIGEDDFTDLVTNVVDRS